MEPMKIEILKPAIILYSGPQLCSSIGLLGDLVKGS